VEQPKLYAPTLCQLNYKPMWKILKIIKEKKEKILIILTLILVGLLFFQIGFIYGSKFFIPCEIKIYKK
jgi:hypothetical protein